jgi:hypothetical protein
LQEDAECPLCLEEMDISDLNFKPCICGYQVIDPVFFGAKASADDLFFPQRFVDFAGITSKKI